MTTKEFLQRSFRLYVALDCKFEQILRLQSLAKKVTTVISGVPSVSADSRLEQSVAVIQSLEENLNADITVMLDARAEIAAAIALVTNDSERFVLEYRYLAFLPWQEISRKMRISLERVYRVHRDAIKNFSPVTVNDSSRYSKNLQMTD